MQKTGIKQRLGPFPIYGDHYPPHHHHQRESRHHAPHRYRPQTRYRIPSPYTNHHRDHPASCQSDEEDRGQKNRHRRRHQARFSPRDGDETNDDIGTPTLLTLKRLNSKLNGLSREDLECLKTMIMIREGGARENALATEPIAKNGIGGTDEEPFQGAASGESRRRRHSEQPHRHHRQHRGPATHRSRIQSSTAHDLRDYTTASLGLCKYPPTLIDPVRRLENRRLFSAPKTGGENEQESGDDAVVVTHDQLMNTDYVLLLRKHFDSLPPSELRALMYDKVFAISNAPTLDVATALADEHISYIKFHRVHNLPVNPHDPYMNTVGLLKYAVFNRLNLADLPCILRDGRKIAARKEAEANTTERNEETETVSDTRRDKPAGNVDRESCSAHQDYQILRQLANKPTPQARTAPLAYVDLHRRSPDSFRHPIQRAVALVGAFSRIVGAIKRRAPHQPGPLFVRDFDDMGISDSYRCGTVSELILGALRSHRCRNTSCRLRLRRLLEPYHASLFFCPYNNTRQTRDGTYRRETNTSYYHHQQQQQQRRQPRVPRLAYTGAGDYPPSGAPFSANLEANGVPAVQTYTPRSTHTARSSSSRWSSSSREDSRDSLTRRGRGGRRRESSPRHRNNETENEFRHISRTRRRERRSRSRVEEREEGEIVELRTRESPSDDDEDDDSDCSAIDRDAAEAATGQERGEQRRRQQQKQQQQQSQQQHPRSKKAVGTRPEEREERGEQSGDESRSSDSEDEDEEDIEMRNGDSEEKRTEPSFHTPEPPYPLIPDFTLGSSDEDEEEDDDGEEDEIEGHDVNGDVMSDDSEATNSDNDSEASSSECECLDLRVPRPPQPPASPPPQRPPPSSQQSPPIQQQQHQQQHGRSQFQALPSQDVAVELELSAPASSPHDGLSVVSAKASLDPFALDMAARDMGLLPGPPASFSFDSEDSDGDDDEGERDKRRRMETDDTDSVWNASITTAPASPHPFSLSEEDKGDHREPSTSERIDIDFSDDDDVRDDIEYRDPALPPAKRRKTSDGDGIDGAVMDYDLSYSEMDSE